MCHTSNGKFYLIEKWSSERISSLFFLIFVKMGDVFSILRMMLDKAFLHLMIAAPFFFLY